MNKREWKIIGSRSGWLESQHFVLEGDGFYISYNPDTSNVLMGFGAGEGSGEETALCHDGKYFILNGDYREDYEKLIDQGYEACKKFYDERNNHSKWSKPYDDDD